MRLFFAIPLGDEVRHALAALQGKLALTRAEVNWVPADNFHVTVKFLGDTDEKFLPELAARLERVAAQVPAFPLEVDGVGRIPEKGPARVIVAGVNSPDQRIVKLHRLLDSAVGGIGLPMDTRELFPHITLGRVKSNHGINRLLRLLDKHIADPIGTFTVHRVALFESTMTPEGSIYRALHTAALHEIRKPSPARGGGSDRRGQRGGGLTQRSIHEKFAPNHQQHHIPRR